MGTRHNGSNEQRAIRSILSGAARTRHDGPWYPHQYSSLPDHDPSKVRADLPTPERNVRYEMALAALRTLTCWRGTDPEATRWAVVLLASELWLHLQQRGEPADVVELTRTLVDRLAAATPTAGPS